MNKLTREVKLNCDTLVNVTLERKEWKTHSGRKNVDIRVSAVMPNGLDLANIHHGLIKRHFDGNPRLRTEASKNKEMTTLMDGIESHLKSIKGAVLDIGDSLDIQVNLTSRDAYVRGIEGVFSLSPNNIKSKTSGVPISWYHHDAYNTGDISVTVTRIKYGWKNYETWNISLWVRNDESLYGLARTSTDYPDFVLRLKELGIEQTPDGVFYADASIDLDALNRVVAEIREG